MPLYDYRCQTCDYVFEVRQSFSSEPVATCPSCNNGAQRVIHSVPVVFKGSGFYVNDYGKGRGGSSSSSSSSESKDSSADKESDTKPKAKSEASSESKKETSAAS